jgi:hypothetical protein
MKNKQQAGRRPVKAVPLKAQAVTVPGLRKRVARAPYYTHSGPKMAHTGPVRPKDAVLVWCADDVSLRIGVDAVDADGALVGTVERIEAPMPVAELDGIALRQAVRVPGMDFVWVVDRR